MGFQVATSFGTLPNSPRFPEASLLRSDSMPGKAAKVLITERQQTIRQQLKNATTASQRLILLASQGLRNEEIAPLINRERHQVGIRRVRWADAFPRLTVIEG